MEKRCPLLLQEEVLPVLHRITIFAGLTPEQLYKIFSLLGKKTVCAGEAIFRQGEPADHIYIIKSGRIKIMAEGAGDRFDLTEFESGHCFGETSVIGIQTHSATAIAPVSGELLTLSRTALLSIFDEDKELFGLLILNIAREACRRLHRSNEVLLHYFLEREHLLAASGKAYPKPTQR